MDLDDAHIDEGADQEDPPQMRQRHWSEVEPEDASSSLSARKHRPRLRIDGEEPQHEIHVPEPLFDTRHAPIEDEWSPDMRYEMQEIVPRIFLGPCGAAKPKQFHRLKGVGITHIVCVRNPKEAFYVKPYFPDAFHYLVLDIVDTPHQNIIPFMRSVRQFVSDAVTSGGAVLVHGVNGISRSAALIIGYLMETTDMSYEQSFRLVQSKRFCAFPNVGFQQQLREYEYIVQATRNTAVDAISERSAKRQLDDDGEDDIWGS